MSDDRIGFSSTFAEGAAPGSPPDSVEDLQTVDRAHYQIDRELARGGMGRIFTARDRRLGRRVAVKEVLAQLDVLIARFDREARLTARLQHPGIVTVYEAGRWPSGEPFYAMRLVAGRPLEDVIAATKTFQERLALVPRVLAIAEALAYAHSERIVHRDLKPANVLVGGFGETVVIDWGLAKELDDLAPEAGATPYRDSDEGALTQLGSIMGTPSYMPIEQALGEPVDERADVYAIGAILYQTLCGQPPYTGRTGMAIVEKLLAGPPTPLAERQAGVPADLLAIVNRAMARDAPDRYRTAKELADELERFQTGQLVASYRYSRWQLVARWLRRHRVPVTVAAALTIVLAIVIAISVQQVVRERDVASAERTAATQSLAALLEEQGRQELLAGRPEKAVVLLAAAYDRNVAPPASLRFFLADAVTSLEHGSIKLDDHTDKVHSLAFSPDGALLVTASEDGSTKLRDGHTGQPIRALAGHTAGVWSARFSADGKRVITGALDQTARLWDVETGAQLASLAHPAMLLGVEMTPAGDRVVTDDEDHARLWDADGRLLATLDGQRKIESAAFTPDGTRFVTIAEDETARIRDARDGKIRVALDGAAPKLSSAQFSPDGRLVVISGGLSKAAVWDSHTGKKLFDLDGQCHHGDRAFSPDGDRIVISSPYPSGVRSARVYDSRSGKLLLSLDGHRGDVRAAGFSGDGTRIATTGGDTTHVWEASTGRLVRTLENPEGEVASIAISPDGSRVATIGMGGAVRLWNVRTDRLVRRLDGYAAAFDADGARIAIATPAGPVIRDISSGSVVTSLQGKLDDPELVAFDAAGARLVTFGADHTATVWNARSGEPVSSLAGHTDRITAAAFSTDGTRLITRGETSIRVWEVETGKQLFAIEGQSEMGMGPILFSRAGEHFVTGVNDLDGAVKVWDARTGDRVATLNGHTGIVNRIAYSPDGSRIVAANWDKTAQVWGARDGRFLLTLEGHGGVVMSARFSPDGNRIVTASADQTARVWDANSGAPLLTLEGHSHYVASAAFSPDAALVATASDDGTAKVWDARTGKLLASLDHGEAVRSAEFSADGGLLLTGGQTETRLWDVHIERRPAGTIAAMVSRRSPWMLSQGVVVRRPPP